GGCKALGDHQGSTQGDLKCKFLLGTFGSVWQSLEKPQSRGQVADRLRVRRTLHRPLSGKLRVFDCLLCVSTVAVMMRELTQVLFQPVAEQCLDRFRRMLVKRLPPLDEQRVVSHFLCERVLERVLELWIE